MSRNEPVDPRVRLAITLWPPDAPRGSVSTFCLAHGISRKTFYEIRRRVEAEGPAAALEPRSRRPRTSPTVIADEVKLQAVGVRAALERSGLDHGPISVHEKMHSSGMTAPSPASLARIFRAGFFGHDRIGKAVARGDIATFTAAQVDDPTYIEAAPAISN